MNIRKLLGIDEILLSVAAPRNWKVGGELQMLFRSELTAACR